MKKYKFSLEAVLKIRKMKEDKCKMEIGRLQVNINEIEIIIEEHNHSIRDAFVSQESTLREGISGQELRFFPYFVSGKRAHIESLEREVKTLGEEVNLKQEELRFLRENVKVMKKMRNKDVETFKKNVEKKNMEEIEAQAQSWNHFLKINKERKGMR